MVSKTQTYTSPASGALTRGLLAVDAPVGWGRQRKTAAFNQNGRRVRVREGIRGGRVGGRVPARGRPEAGGERPLRQRGPNVITSGSCYEPPTDWFHRKSIVFSIVCSTDLDLCAVSPCPSLHQSPHREVELLKTFSVQ